MIDGDCYLSLQQYPQAIKAYEPLKDFSLPLAKQDALILKKLTEISAKMDVSLKKEVNELKLCAYIKVGMDNKEIAEVSNVALASTKKGINLLKKKLKLSAEESVRDFMMSDQFREIKKQELEA